MKTIIQAVTTYTCYDQVQIQFIAPCEQLDNVTKWQPLCTKCRGHIIYKDERIQMYHH